MTITPHPQRCETCTKTIHKCPICVTGGYEIRQLQQIVSLIGCASHSSFHTTNPMSNQKWYCPFQIDCEDGKSYCEWPCERWFAWHDEQIQQQLQEHLVQKLELRKTNLQKIYSTQSCTMKEMGKIRIEEMDGVLEFLRSEIGKCSKECCEDCPSCPIGIYNSCEDRINPDAVKP